MSTRKRAKCLSCETKTCRPNDVFCSDRCGSIWANGYVTCGEYDWCSKCGYADIDHAMFNPCFKCGHRDLDDLVE